MYSCLTPLWMHFLSAIPSQGLGWRLSVARDMGWGSISSNLRVFDEQCLNVPISRVCSLSGKIGDIDAARSFAQRLLAIECVV